MQNTPRPRPLEVNDIDHTIRCHGGRTVATDMEPSRMFHSKRSEDIVQYIDFLNRRNGELRLEVTFYRDCYSYSEKFKETIAKISQDLLHECIIGLLDDTAFDEIRTISRSIIEAVEKLRGEQKKAFDTFVAPYRASNIVPGPRMSTDGSF